MWRRATIGLLLLYAACVIAITIFPIRVRPASYWADEPFMTMVHWIPGDVDAPSFTLNVIMFIPLGVLVPLLWPSADSPWAIGWRALAASASIETVQLILGLTLGSRRTIDINDLIANSAGALLGLLILRLAVPSAQHRAAACPPASRSRAAHPAPQTARNPEP
ncbi:VanZ family protein [Actinoplanes sp. NPDC051346]|uniref:VanZ family protein n=1 Tax=Actinoplanes sp. NPDC051346 TaxID=3155048 RepID=UPI00341D10F1